ncbi:MAG: T9SS type A sorting domain-containing protein [Chitinophagales bacterium]|nr:T9SS type A sorting domain-containing protein [Chitinophagales bacterium]
MKLRYTYLFFVVVAAWVLLKSNSSGRVSTGTPMQACAGGGCHSSTGFGTTTSIDSILVYDRATNLPVSQYMPGQSYRIAIFGRVTNFMAMPNLPKFGFAVDNAGKGTFSGTSSGSTTASSGRYWGHSSKKDSILSISAIRTIFYFDSCNWTAPSAGAGLVTYTARLNAVNNDNGSTGDFSNATAFTRTLPEFNNTAGVSITMTPPANPFCAGTTKTFIATPTNPGTTPVYQWFVNSTPVGTGGVSYTTSSLVNNDSVWVRMTSSIAGITNNPANSAKIGARVNPAFNNSVTIIGNKTTACAGDTVIFTATPAAGSTMPQYRWYRNMTQIQGPGAPFPAPTTNSATCQVIGLTAGDSFSCRVQVTNACATPANDTSNYLKITVTPSPVITGHINDTICAGDSSKATNWQSTIAGTTYTWTNSNPAIGLPASGTGQIPKFKSPDAIAGPQITATITIRSFGGGCSGSPVTYNILVRRKPTISISGHQRSYCEGASPNITIGSTGGGNTFSWTNDNTAIGLPASGSGATIAFTASNTTTDSLVANVTASVFNSAARCTKDTSIRIVVFPKPNVNAISNIAPCEGNTVPAFNLNSTVPGTTFTWVNSNTAIGLGASGTGNIPSFTATNTSSGPITGTVTISPAYKTCLGTNRSFTITVEKNATPSVSISTSAMNLCSGASALFTATPTNGGTAPVYEWTRNGITISGATKDTVTITNVQNNDKIVCKITSNSPCATTPNASSNEYSITTITNLVPKVTLSTISDTTCVGAVLVINTSIVNGGASPTYQWYLNGNPIFGANSDIFFSNTFVMDDEIYCEMTSSSGCANPKTVVSNTKKIKVFKPTPTTINLTKSANKICSDEYVTFTTTFTGGGLNPKVNWTLNGQQMNTNKKFITVPINSQFDVVELNVKSSEPCPSPPYPTLTMSVDSVSQGPIVIVTPNPYIAFCEGDSAEIRILNGAPNYKYNWSNGSNASNFYSKVTNSYTLTVTETGNACPRYYGPITTVANPLPFKPTISADRDVLVSSASDRYQWQLNKQDIVSADSMRYKPIITGLYRVKVTNNAGCIAYSDEFNSAKLGVSSFSGSNKILIYPNPSNGIFTISSKDVRIDDLIVYDLMGKVVYQSKVGDIEKEIKLNEVSKGIYFLHINLDGRQEVQKLEIK